MAGLARVRGAPGQMRAHHESTAAVRARLERASADLRPPGHALQTGAALGVTGPGAGCGARLRARVAAVGGLRGFCILTVLLGRRHPVGELVGAGDVDAGVRPALHAQLDAHTG